MSKLFSYVLLLLSLFATTYASDEESNTQKYITPVPSGNVYFAEPFDKISSLDNWIISKAKKDGVDEEIAKYNGRWEVVQPLQILLDDDLGLLLKDRARHNAISAKLTKPYEFSGKPFVMQYEVNFQNGIECGGGYVKLLTQTEDLDLDNFNDKTPYTVMFGPDKCGESYKLHFIFRHKNPKTGEFEEKHAKQTTSDLKGPYGDKAFHLYTLVVNPDNSFVMFLDQKEINRGSLLEDMSPPVNPPEEIEDKDDRKPDDWDERETIVDPDASKPDDWDEDAPAKIPDPDAEMPDGWLEDEPLYVDDPDADRPDDWDDDMDGEWEAPKVENPKCEEAPGCGMWEPPMIDNPEFKGKWRPPMIANPDYKGIWKPRMIPNPDYFEDKEPYKMTSIGAVGLELWSMSDSIMFDNFIITDDLSVAQDYAEKTWKQKKIVRAKNEPGMLQGLIDATNERPWLWAIYAVVVGLPLVLIFTFCCGGKKTKSDAEKKKTDEPTPDDPHESEEENQDQDKDDDDDEKKTDDADAEENKSKLEGSGDATKKPSKTDLEEDDEEEEEEEEQEEEVKKEKPTANRRSPRSKPRRE